MPLDSYSGAPQAPSWWPVYGAGAPEAGRPVSQAQALAFSAAPTLLSAGAVGATPYNPSYDTPSVTGASDTYHVGVDGRLWAPVSATPADLFAPAPAPWWLQPQSPPDHGGLFSPTLGAGQTPQRDWSRQGLLPDPGGAANVDPNSRPNMPLLEDSGRSLITGLEQGVTGIAGMPGDVEQAIGKGLAWGAANSAAALGLVGDKDGFQRRLEASLEDARKQSAAQYTSADLDHMVQSVAGPYHVPQTAVGRLANTVGQYAPGVVLPGGMAARVARVGIPALASWGAGEATGQNPWARGLAGLVGGGLASLSEGALARGAGLLREPVPPPAPRTPLSSSTPPEPPPDVEVPSEAGTRDSADWQSKIPTIGGRKPRNWRLAQGLEPHPAGVWFTEQGFPNFRPFAKAEVELEGLTGNYDRDAALANQRAGFAETPQDHTWHHVEDMKTMQLIPTKLHKVVGHTGGMKVIRNGGFDR